MDNQIKAKISQCLAYSMEIEGAKFSHNPEAGCISVYEFNGADYLFNFSVYSYTAEKLDKMITDLINHISKSNLENALNAEL